MTVPLTSNRNDFTGSGSASVFSFTFPVFVQADLQVIVTDSNYSETTLTIGTDYTVSGLNPSGGPATTGSVTLVNNSQSWLTAGNLATGYTLSIVRNASVVQNTSLRNQGSYFPEVIENQLDYIVMMVQRLSALGLILPGGIPPLSFSPILPANLQSSAGKVLMVNSTGTAFVIATPTTVAIAVPLPISQGGTGSIASLAGNRIIISSGQTIIEAAIIASAKIIGTDANGLPISSSIGFSGSVLTGLGAGASAGQSLRYEQLFGGDLTLIGNLIFNPTTKGVKGTTTNDNTAAGNVGEYVEALQNGNLNAAATGVYDDLTSISLTAGDWDVFGCVAWSGNGATGTQFRVAVSVTSGNSAAGLVPSLSEYVNVYAAFPASAGMCTPRVRFSLAAPATVYLKRQAIYTVGTPLTASGAITARRIR